MRSTLPPWYPVSPKTRSPASRTRCWVRWPRAPTRGLSENGARRTTIVSSDTGLLLSPNLVLHRRQDRRGVLPVRDAVLLEGHRVAVLVDLGPVRVVQLVEGEAGVERDVEAHVVDGLVDRLLDEQRGHRRLLGDPPGELDRALLEVGGREHLADHAERVGLVDADRVAGQEQLLGLARPELPGMAEVLDAAHAESGTDDIGEG